MKPALIIGSTCVDVILNVDRLPQTGDDAHILSQTFSVGGCAWNVSSVLRLMDAPHTLISPVGGGIFGDFVAKYMEEHAVPVRLRFPQQENGCCYCFVDPSGERTFLSRHGVEYSFQKEWMKSCPAGDYSIAYLCGLEVEEPTGEQLVQYLEEHPSLPVCYAPGPRGIRVPKERTDRIFALHPLLHLNEREAMELTGAPGYVRAARMLQERTQGTVIVTLGPKGAYCAEQNGSAYLVPSTPVSHIADTIGAGDSHIGAVLGCLIQGLSLKDAVRYANRVSAAVLGVRGAALTKGLLPPL